MNYLAHAYLSFGHGEILVGNMISDFVKGKKQYDYPELIFKGIKLHRAIDDFTDTHDLIKEMKKPFREIYGLYAGAFTDIVCDYFLANDTKEFSSEEALLEFTRSCYKLLQDRKLLMPLIPFQEFFFYMQRDNWLYNYRLPVGIERAFKGISNRAKYITDYDSAFQIFMNNRKELQVYYEQFFPLLKNYSLAIYNDILKTD